ncbi:hypothetical protein D3C75_894930 [compost metagenome]
MGHDAQFNLRIVRRDNTVAFRGNKCLPDAASFVVTHRDILQVGIAGRETPGSRHRLMIGSMHPTTHRVNHQRQLVGIGGFQLRQATVFQDHFRQQIIQRQLGQHFLIG